MPDGSDDKNRLIDPLNLSTKRAVEKFCQDQTITKSELSDVLWAASFGELSPYLYARHFDQLVPEHLLPTEEDNGSMLAGMRDAKGSKFVRKVAQIFAERRMFCFHVLFTPAKDHWHLIYFNQRDMSGDTNHWRGGSHIHYSRDGYVNASFEKNVGAGPCAAAEASIL